MFLENFETVLIKTIPIFLAIAIGLFAKKYKWFGENSSEVVASLAFKLASPFLIFLVLYKLTFNSDNINILLIGVIAFFLLFITSFLLGKALKLEKKTLYTFALMMAGFMGGGLAYPFAQLNFDEDVFQSVVLMDMVMFFLIVTVGYAISIFASDTSKITLAKMLKKIFLSPAVLAIIITLVINYAKIEVPGEFLDTADFFAKSFALLATLLIGLTLEMPNLKSTIPLGGAFVLRFALVMAVCFVFTQILKFSDPQEIAIYLILATPFSSLPLIYAQEQNLNVKFAAQLSVFSIIIALILYPVLIAALK